jgi:hypothetical protein
MILVFDGRPRATGRARSPSWVDRSRLSLRSSQMQNACSSKKHRKAEKFLASLPKMPAPARSAVRTWPVRRKSVRRSNMRNRAKAVSDSFTGADMPACQTKTPRLPRRTARLRASIAPAGRSALPIDNPLFRSFCTRLDSGTPHTYARRMRRSPRQSLYSRTALDRPWQPSESGPSLAYRMSCRCIACQKIAYLSLSMRKATFKLMSTSENQPICSNPPYWACQRTLGR